MDALLRRAAGVLFGHALPAALFAFFTTLKAGLVLQAASALTSPDFEVSASAVLLFVVQLLGLVYYGLLGLLFAIRLPRLGGRRTPWTVVVTMFATFAILTVGILPDDQPRPWLDGLPFLR